MEKARKKELLENFCCKEVIFRDSLHHRLRGSVLCAGAFPGWHSDSGSPGGGGGQCWPSGHPGAVSERPANPALALVTVRGDRV
ncbi:hypothetical protein LAWASA_3717 [Lawsonibacter asaccharolyticus]|nr:hypothetical protein LAWASA_3717 [Lawsonibacter asaccharolyticus]